MYIKVHMQLSLGKIPTRVLHHELVKIFGQICSGMECEKMPQGVPILELAILGGDWLC